jgi:hypothetical protein
MKELFGVGPQFKNTNERLKAVEMLLKQGLITPDVEQSLKEEFMAKFGREPSSEELQQLIMESSQ